MSQSITCRMRQRQKRILPSHLNGQSFRRPSAHCIFRRWYNIEEVAASTPDAIKKLFLGFSLDDKQDKLKQLFASIGMSADIVSQSVATTEKLFNCFMKTDCTQVEINPLIVTKEDKVLVADAKLNFDDNAEFRQKEIFEQRDLTQEDSRDVEAKKLDVN